MYENGGKGVLLRHGAGCGSTRTFDGAGVLSVTPDTGVCRPRIGSAGLYGPPARAGGVVGRRGGARALRVAAARWFIGLGMWGLASGGGRGCVTA